MSDSKLPESKMDLDEKSPSGKNFYLSKKYNERTLSKLIHNSKLDIVSSSNLVRSSGIICTIGPKSQSVEMLVSLIKSGMDVVRMNCSHGDHGFHGQTIKNAHEAARQTSEHIAVALDTKGPEIRTGNFIGDKEYILELNSQVIITTNKKFINQGTEKKFYLDYDNIGNVCKIGDLVFIDDGLISLKIIEISSDKSELTTVVCNSGAISNHKGVNLPGCEVDLPAISEKDANDLKFGVENNVDMIFASFIRKKQDILDIRQKLISFDAKKGKLIQIIAKIENMEGCEKFDEIINCDDCDGVMVARGDLGIEIPSEKVFLAQKYMISKCNIIGKPCIVATQMLDSMIRNPRPTRAEVTDVANAILDGSDCVMLSGETAKGAYIQQSVQMMAKICREAETCSNNLNFLNDMTQTIKSRPKNTRTDINETICCNAVESCFEQLATAIIVLTNSGNTARILSKFRPPCPVIAVVGSSHSYTARQLRITYGVYSIVYDDSKGKLDANIRVQKGLNWAKSKNWVKTNDRVIVVHADEMGMGYANLIKIIQVQ